MRKYAHKMPLEYVRHDFTQNDLSWMKKYHINVSIDKNILSDDMIQLFETNNIKINIWTINNKDQLYNFTNKGIKIVTSDDVLWKVVTLIRHVLEWLRIPGVPGIDH